MMTAKRPSIYLYLGRHETTASGLWVYGKTILHALLGFFEALQEGGLEVPLLRVGFGGSQEFRDELAELFSHYHIDIELYQLPLCLKSRRLSMILDLFRSTHGAALVHGTANLVPLAFRAKRILTLHDTLQARSPVPAEFLYVRLRRYFYNAMLWLQTRLAHVIITDHDIGRVQLERFTHCGEKIRIVYPPLDRSYLEAPLPKEKEAQESLLAFASRDPRKNIDNLLFAFAAWIAHKDWKLKIICNSAYVTEHLRELALSLRIDSHIEFMQDVPQWEMPLMYESVRALLFPSLGEGFGYPIYEALSQGVPVVCARGSVIGPLFKYVSPALVESDSMTGKGLVDALERVAALKLRFQERILAAEAVRAALSDDLMTRELLRIYRKLAPKLFISRQLS